ncbi:hypothetical protein UlMin_031882 [Ulmus minor]
MEVVKQWEEDLEEAEAEALRRLPRQYSNTTTTITTVTKNEAEASSSIDEQSLEEEKTNGTRTNGTSSDQNGGTKSTNGFSGMAAGHFVSLGTKENSDDISDLKAEIVDIKASIVSLHQENDNKKLDLDPSPSEISQYKESGDGNIEDERVTLGENRGELHITEINLDRLGNHKFYCPNCEACITKVIIREIILETIPPTTPVEPVDCFRCTSCLSFLMPAGDWWFLRWINGQTKGRPEGGMGSVGGLAETPHGQPSHVPGLLAGAIATEANAIPGKETSKPVPPVSPLQPGRVSSEVQEQPGRVSSEVQEQPGRVSSEVQEQPGQVSIQPPGDSPTATNTVPDNVIVHSKEPVLPQYSNETQNPVPHQPIKPGVIVPPKPSGLYVPPSTGEIVTETPTLASGGNNLPGQAIENRPGETVIPMPTPKTPQPSSGKTLEILKSVVYGGLTESIMSLGIVTSSASADATTLNIMSLALANLLGGLFIIGHNLWDLKDDRSKVSSDDTKEVEKYQQLLGKRENFLLHASVVILSFLVFGLVSPLVYGFSFRQSDDKDLKLAVVAAASFFCIILLAIGKAHIKTPQNYMKTVMYYIVVGVGVSGVSYLAGKLINKLLVNLGLFDSTSAVNLILPGVDSAQHAWGFY